jgi:hypothetical protein
MTAATIAVAGLCCANRLMADIRLFAVRAVRRHEGQPQGSRFRGQYPPFGKAAGSSGGRAGWTARRGAWALHDRLPVALSGFAPGQGIYGRTVQRISVSASASLVSCASRTWRRRCFV